MSADNICCLKMNSRNERESMTLVGGKSQAIHYNGSLVVTVVFVAANNIRIQRSFEVYPLEFQPF